MSASWDTETAVTCSSAVGYCFPIVHYALLFLVPLNTTNTTTWPNLLLDYITTYKQIYF